MCIVNVMETRRPFRRTAIRLPEQGISNVVFSPGGDLVAAVCHYERKTLWRRLLALETDFKAIRLWDVAFVVDEDARFDPSTGMPVCCGVIDKVKGSVCSLAVSADGSMVATGNSLDVISLWDVRTAKCIAQLDGHRGRITCLMFSDDGKLLASGGADWTVRLWEVETRRCLGVFEGHKSAATSLDFSDDGRLLASGSKGWGAHAMVWDLEALCRVCELSKDDYRPGTFVSISPDGRLLASGNSNSMGSAIVWRIPSRDPCGTAGGHDAVFATAKTGHVPSAPSAETIQLSQNENCMVSPCLSYPGDSEALVSLSFRADGSLVIVSASEHRSRVKEWQEPGKKLD